MKNLTSILLALLAALACTAALAQVPISVGAIPTPGAGNQLPAGLYVSVTEGMVILSNKGGVQNFSAGQFGFTPTPIQAPVVVPKNPGLQFAPPPAFNMPLPVAGTGTSPPKSNAVDCIVR